MNPYAFTRLDDAIAALACSLEPVGVEARCHGFCGRVLAEPIRADRDHPPADVSAMDGYAVAFRDSASSSELDSEDELLVAGESVPGSPPPTFLPIGVIRIFTGGLVPADCDRVIQREHTIERPPSSAYPLGSIQWRTEARDISSGANIRRRGENLGAGEQALPAGIVIGAPQIAALASFGVRSASVHRRVRVAIITTGDEVSGDTESNSPLPPWRIRNSNAPAITTLMASRPFVDMPTLLHALDEPDQLRQTLATAVAEHDIVILTGGVSMGDHDYVPRVVSELGAETIFHKLPLRPGKPILGAIHTGPSESTSSGSKLTPILGLPGNPVSATMGAVRFAFPLIDKLAGLTRWQSGPTTVMLDEIGPKTLPLVWLRAVRLTGDGSAELVIGKGSGDLVSLAASDGFIEMPPGANHVGPWPFYSW